MLKDLLNLQIEFCDVKFVMKSIGKVSDAYVGLGKHIFDKASDRIPAPLSETDGV